METALNIAQGRGAKELSSQSPTRPSSEAEDPGE